MTAQPRLSLAVVLALVLGLGGTAAFAHDGHSPVGDPAPQRDTGRGLDGRVGFRGCNNAFPGVLAAIRGIRHDMDYLRCSGVDPRRFKVVREFESRPRANGLPDLQWHSGLEAFPAQFSFIRGHSMHWCGPNAFIKEYYVERNTFRCVELDWQNPETEPTARPLDIRILDGQAPHVTPEHFTTYEFEFDDPQHGRGRKEMHACPKGYVIVGMHHDFNVFLCGLLYPRRAD